MRHHYEHDFDRYKKLIVGEGESDLSFFAAFCVANQIEGFEYAFVGEHETKTNGEYGEAGFDNFHKYLTSFGRTSAVQKVKDIVLVCDSATLSQANPTKKFNDICTQINQCSHGPERISYVAPPAANEVNNQVTSPRVHVLVVPWHDKSGGIETLCLEAARQAAGAEANQIFGCVNNFAECINITALTDEKKDKFRLQSFLSGAWKKRPDIRAEQVWRTNKSELFALTSDIFHPVRDFLIAISQLQ